MLVACSCHAAAAAATAAAAVLSTQRCCLRLPLPLPLQACRLPCRLYGIQQRPSVHCRCFYMESEEDKEVVFLTKRTGFVR